MHQIVKRVHTLVRVERNHELADVVGQQRRYRWPQVNLSDGGMQPMADLPHVLCTDGVEFDDEPIEHRDRLCRIRCNQRTTLRMPEAREEQPGLETAMELFGNFSAQTLFCFNHLPTRLA